MKRGVVVLLVSIAVWFVSLAMVNAKPRRAWSPTHASLAPPSAAASAPR
jgi:hypothetical protein